MSLKYFKYFTKVKSTCSPEKMANGVTSIVTLDCTFGLISIVINSLKAAWGFRVCNFFSKVTNHCGAKWTFFNKTHLEKNKRKKRSASTNSVNHRFGLNIGISKVELTPRSNVWACARNCAGIAFKDRIVRKTLHVAVRTAAFSCELEAKFSFYFDEVHRRW